MMSANIFFQAAACLLVLLTVPFTKHKSLILMKSNLQIITFMDCNFSAVTKVIPIPQD